jgi:two-component system sensor histidine kinase KdpD
VLLDAEDHQEMLEVIDEEADRLNRFIESLVELARIEAGEMRLRRRWVPVEEIVDSALGRARPHRRQHEFEVSVDETVPIIRVDAQAIAEVVYNLIDNAAKYSRTSGKITISARQSGEMIRLTVQDEGRGIPPELRERVFEKFFRVNRAGRPGHDQPSGTGMGLAIAKGIVEAHGGRIWIEDARNGSGAAAIVELPIRRL